MLFAQAAPTELDKLKDDLTQSVDLYAAMGFAFFLLLGYAALLVGWAAYRRWRPAPPGQTAVPVGFVAWLFAGLVALPWLWRQVQAGWDRLSQVEQADVVVISHLGFVLGVMVAQLLVLAGWAWRWGWVRNFYFRLGHLISIHLVASQPFVGAHCPLTSWEWKLRSKALDENALDQASPLARWCHDVLFHTPGHTLVAIYVTFAAVVLLSWLFIPPRWPGASPDVATGRGGRADRGPPGD